MKNIIKVLIISFVLLFNTKTVLAGQFDNIVGDDGKTTYGLAEDISKGTLSNKSLIEIVGNVIHIILGLSALVTFVFIVWGGVEWTFSQGNPDVIAKARTRVINAAVGIIIISISFAITEFILNQIKFVTK